MKGLRAYISFAILSPVTADCIQIGAVALSDGIFSFYRAVERKSNK